ncbi:hypothetical protein [Paenibacillus naphthalenovorans]|uniref:hypothetical protein n=1 Tax=Paenibacillus naphthalenovorans TaxID=162209 RepID=UPI003D272BC2
MSTKEDAAAWCPYIHPDRTCALMIALATESNPVCKRWREPEDDCRFLRLVVAKRK